MTARVGLRDADTGEVWWERTNLPAWLARRYRSAGWTVYGSSEMPSGERVYHVGFVGECAPWVDEEIR